MIYIWLVILSIALAFLYFVVNNVMESVKLLISQVDNVRVKQDQNVKLMKKIEAKVETKTTKTKKKDSV